MNNKKLKSGVYLVLILMFMLTMTGCTISNLSHTDRQNEPKESFQVSTNQNKPLLTASDAAEKVLPSVVGVLSYKNSSDMSYSFEGSGVVMSKDGYIITNAHVIEGAAKVQIVLADGSVYTSSNSTKSFWYDTYTDIGLVKINANNLIPAEFGDSNELRIAEDVLAIGNPGGIAYQSSVTKGIVSAKSRPYEPIKNSGYIIDCIQTDAAINPGNSGGALINLYGQVIGINSAKIVDVDFEGMGFSIKINEVQPIIQDLLNNGYMSGRPALGITAKFITLNALEDGEKQIKNKNGLLIDSITNTSLIESGIAKDNIIIDINGTEITSIMTVTKTIKPLKVGDKVNIKYYVLGTYVNNNSIGYHNVTLKTSTITLVELKP